MSAHGNERSEFEDRLAAVPDLRDQPLEATWLRGDRTVERADYVGRGEYHADPGARVEASPPGRDEGFVEPSIADHERRDEPEQGDRSTVRARRRRRWPRVLFTLLLLVLVGIGGLGFYAKRQFDNVERVAVSDLLAGTSPGGTNYLIVGSDSRENLDPDVENAGAIFGDGTEDFGGQRTDTIEILRIGDDGSKSTLAIPRDLYVSIPGYGSNRVNAAYASGGPELLIETIQGSLGIPIAHYAEIDFAGFIELVDAVGGVTIDFPHPAFDNATGLNVPEAGPQLLDSTQALAFVRSRKYYEVIDGQAVIDPRGDLGRVKRQQQFMQALAAKLDSPRHQASALLGSGVLVDSIRVDDSLSFADAVALANDLRDVQLDTEWDLTVSYGTTNDGASVLILDQAASQPVLDYFSGAAG